MKSISAQYIFNLFCRETVYGNEKAIGGSQPPMMLVFHGKYTDMDPIWHIRNLGKSLPLSC